ncbi:APC family permease [Pseudotamlana agarivorans]|uniref:APC family permease n=1 Tax=Pseudotamlana agarivorans TaxID=481183 RepID=UPI00082E110A|nr:amino acid permease [Tamlana agarivorans]
MKPNIPIKISTYTGVALVVANMVGTGAFTSLGFQLSELKSPSTIIFLWVLGGVIALCGAFSYAEVGSQIRKSGGEYIFLSELFHPLIGYLSGWISITVGFAAPIALSAIAVIEYFPYYHLSPKWAGILLIGFITLIHSLNLKVSAKVQNISTLLKVFLIVLLITIGLVLPAESNAISLNTSQYSELFTPAFIIALIYVSYSYSGWNAAVYIIEEFKNPKKSIPRALVIGTSIVTVLYTLLQYVFLKMASLDDLVGKLNVGHIVSENILGSGTGNLFSFAISLLLVSGISAMVWVGARVTSSMAKDYQIWRFFRNKEGTIPKAALWLQFMVTAIILVTGTFEQVLIYCGFLLTISSAFTVFGVFKLRLTKHQYDKSTFKSPFYPVPQIIFLVFSIGMVFFAIYQYPAETAIGSTNVLAGIGSWFLNKYVITKNK